MVKRLMQADIVLTTYQVPGSHPPFDIGRDQNRYTFLARLGPPQPISSVPECDCRLVISRRCFSWR